MREISKETFQFGPFPMFYCHVPVPRDANPSGKFLHVARPKRITVERREHRGWTYEISRCKVGVTIKRDRYSVSIWWGRRAYRQGLPGFPTVHQARDAAIKRIDAILAARQEEGACVIYHGPHGGPIKKEIPP